MSEGTVGLSTRHWSVYCSSQELISHCMLFKWEKDNLFFFTSLDISWKRSSPLIWCGDYHEILGLEPDVMPGWDLAVHFWAESKRTMHARSVSFCRRERGWPCFLLLFLTFFFPPSKRIKYPCQLLMYPAITSCGKRAFFHPTDTGPSHPTSFVRGTRNDFLCAESKSIITNISFEINSNCLLKLNYCHLLLFNISKLQFKGHSGKRNSYYHMVISWGNWKSLLVVGLTDHNKLTFFFLFLFF